jgi:hypothetical protein
MSISPRYASHVLGEGAHTVELYLDYVSVYSNCSVSFG